MGTFAAIAGASARATRQGDRGASVSMLEARNSGAGRRRDVRNLGFERLMVAAASYRLDEDVVGFVPDSGRGDEAILKWRATYGKSGSAALAIAGARRIFRACSRSIPRQTSRSRRRNRRRPKRFTRWDALEAGFAQISCVVAGATSRIDRQVLAVSAAREGAARSATRRLRDDIGDTGPTAARAAQAGHLNR